MKKTDPSRLDILEQGQLLVEELNRYSDVSSKSLEKQVSQLSLHFDQAVVTQLDKVVDCPAIDGVVLNTQELNELSDIIREAAYEKNRQKESKVQSGKNMKHQHKEESSTLDLLSDHNELLQNSVSTSLLTDTQP